VEGGLRPSKICAHLLYHVSYYTRKLYEMRKNQNQVSLHVHIN